MLLKRIYKIPDGWEKKVNDRGECTNPPPLDHIALADTGIQPEQNFSTDLVASAIKEGWMTIAGKTLTLRCRPEDLRYTIKRGPGRYCLHCGERLESDAGGALARLHVATHHKDEPSPVPSVPAGYEQINHFECVIDSAQHEKYRNRKPGGPRHFIRPEVTRG